MKTIVTNKNITVFIDGKTFTVPREGAICEDIVKAIQENNVDEVRKLVDIAGSIERFSHNNFTVERNTLMFKGKAIPEILSRKIFTFYSNNLPFEPLVKFAENLLANPSERSVQELFNFLSVNDHPITNKGTFVAYKKVRSSFLDIHSGTMDNSVGKVVSMPRESVNPDCNVTCSYGLHVANWDYAKNHFGSHEDIMLEVEVNPRDVVSVPIDYNSAKMRVCEYKVLNVITEAHDGPLRVIESKKENDSDVVEST